MTERRRRGLYAALIVLAALTAALVAVRLMLPEWIRSHAERRLSEAPEYVAHIGSVELRLLAGGAIVRDLRLLKESGQVPTPFLNAPRSEVYLDWRSLWHGVLAARASAQGAQVNVVAGPDQARTQAGIDPAWVERLRQGVPFRLSAFHLTGGEVHYRDFHSSPRVDVYVRDLDARLSNLTNVEEAGRERYADLRLTGTILENGRLNIDGRFDPLGRPPSFQAEAAMENIDLRQLNDLFRAYASVDVKQGAGNIYAAVAAQGGGYDGYVKPLLRHVEVLEQKDLEKGPLRFLWEALVAGAKQLLENEPKRQVAAIIPVKGRFENTDIDVLTAIGWLLRNAFVEALRQGVGDSLGLDGARSSTRK